MPEPVILIIGGIALYKYFKGSPAAPISDIAVQPSAATSQGQPLATVPTGALATNTSQVNQGVAPLAVSGEATAIPSDLMLALDNDTALMFRAYATLNPDDFQAFLNRYADRLVLRNDLFIEALTNPPAGGYELTPGMMVGLGSAAYKVGQALNGVYVGRSVDVFGVAASAAGQIPGVNADLVSSLQAAAMGYRVITGITDIMTVAAAYPGVSVMELGGMMAGGVTAYPGLAAMPLAGVLMAVGLVVDIGFTIIGDKPDVQKAIDVALDVASLAVLFIPVIGVVIAIVIQLVKFIIDLFGDDLFGGGMSHEQREVLETARYGENLNPMYPELSNAYTPRELWRTIVAWGSGYCGGRHVVAMSVSLILHAGDTFKAGGVMVTVPPELDGATFGFGDNEQPGGCYWIKSWANGQLPQMANITNDEQAWLLGVYAPVNGVTAMAQAGIADWRKVQFNDPTQKLIMARATPMRDFLLKYHLSLDQCDQIAMEYRAQPHLIALAESFGWSSWQELFGYTVAAEWRAYTWSTTNGSLSEFARRYGYPSMYAMRAAALSTYEAYFARVEQAGGTLYQNALAAQQAQLEAFMLTQQQASASAP